jgi:hypothetical protein
MTPARQSKHGHGSLEQPDGQPGFPAHRVLRSFEDGDNKIDKKSA